MKLSTFVKQVRKDFFTCYNDPDWTDVHIYLCNRCHHVLYKLVAKYPNSKNISAYIEFERLCKNFICNRLKRQETVRQYLVFTRQLPVAVNMYAQECNEYRIKILDEMLDWAIAQEESHQL